MEASSEIEIRLARPEDASSVARVLHEAFVEYESLYTREGFVATTPNVEQVLNRMLEGPVWIASRSLQILATVSAVVKGKSLYIRGMAVLPAARGSGVGARLLAQCEEWAALKECSRLFLSTTPFLSAAIRLYEKSGFRRTNDGPLDLFGTPLFTMEKDVRKSKRTSLS
jgi:GNAT superfamily N-acetyltransferase